MRELTHCDVCECAVCPVNGFFGRFELFYKDHVGTEGSVLDIVTPFLRVPRAKAFFAFCSQTCWDAFAERIRAIEGI